MHGSLGEKEQEGMGVGKHSRVTYNRQYHLSSI